MKVLGCMMIEATCRFASRAFAAARGSWKHVVTVTLIRGLLTTSTCRTHFRRKMHHGYATRPTRRSFLFVLFFSLSQSNIEFRIKIRSFQRCRKNKETYFFVFFYSSYSVPLQFCFFKLFSSIINCV